VVKKKRTKADKILPREEMFCRAMALAPSTGMSQRECYIKAYICQGWEQNSIDCEASKLAAKPKITQRIKELTKEFADFLNYDAKAHFDELEKEHKMANPKGKRRNPYISLRAVELKGKMTGRYKERHEHTGKDGESLLPTKILIQGVPMDKEEAKR